MSIGHNYLNLPQVITKGASNETLNYTYDATGQKLRKQFGTQVTDYAGGIQYTNNSIEFIRTEEGRAIPGSSYTYEYFLKDHLGNTRAVVKQDGTITQVQDYYAFGLEMNPGNEFAGSPANRYTYNGKEKQVELGLNQLDYGARFYDPVIARWNVIDPKTELYLNHSTYTYVANNPIILIDPNGMEILSVEDGVEFTDDDAVNAFKVLSGRARNVYVDIEGNSGRRKAINAQDKKASYGSWAVFSVENLSKANLALSAFENYSIENLALETHGTVNSQGISFIATNDVEGKKEYINSNEIAYVNSGATNAVNNRAIQSKIADLKSIAAKVTDGGRFIIASCFVGMGDAGKTFGANLSELTGNRFKTYLATGFLKPGEYTSSTGPGIHINDSFRVDKKIGWLQVNPNGTSQDLKTLRLSANSVSPVNITK